MPRGRAPAPSVNGGNRSDLVNPRPQPITTVPGQAYGQQTDQQEAQRIAPMSGGGAPTAPSPGGPPQQGPQGPPAELTDPTAFNGPGLQPFTRPTERPNEPVTHGLPGGPGAGPEALTGVGAAAREGAVEQGTLRNLLSSLSTQPNATSAVKALAALSGAGVQ